MSQEEARLLLDAWNYFDSHPKEKFWEGLPGISRNEFYRLMPVITGIENLVEAKIYLGRFAQGEISQTVPGTIIEKAKEADIPKPYIEDSKRATASVRAWIKNIKPKTAEALAEREVAVAQVKAELARIEEVRIERQKIEVAPPKAPAPIPRTPVPSPPSEEPVFVGIKTTPARAGAFQKFTSKVTTLPIRTVVEWSRPTLAASEPQRVAALTLWARGISSEKLEEKVSALEGKEKTRLLELVKAIKNEEQTFSVQTQLLRRAFPIKDINFLLGPESGLSQAQVAIFFAPEQQGEIFVVPRRSFLGNILIRAGQQLFGKASSKFLKKATAKAAAKVAARVAAKLGLRAAAAAAGAPGGLLGVVAGFLASFIPDAVSWLKRNFRKVAIGLGALVFAAGFLLQSGVLMAGGALVGFGGLVAQAGGVGPALSSAAGVTSSVISGIASLSVASIATPLIVALISIPVLVAVILFIINSGAYIVPPFTAGGAVPEECQGEGPEKPEAKGVLFSGDGRYAYPLAPANSVGEDCTHWDKTLATDIFPIGGNGLHTPVIAYTSGVVHETSTTDPKGGKYIILRGGDGRYYYYAHNCALYVRPGQSVSAGEVIATTDKTGSAAKTPEHLHFAISNFPRFQEGGTVCPSEDFADRFSSYNRCPPEKRCVP